MKELTYMHSEGIMSGELKHGPLAMVDKVLPIVMIITKDRLYQVSTPYVNVPYLLPPSWKFYMKSKVGKNANNDFVSFIRQARVLCRSRLMLVTTYFAPYKWTFCLLFICTESYERLT